jgi:hypothetical protein
MRKQILKAFQGGETIDGGNYIPGCRILKAGKRIVRVRRYCRDGQAVIALTSDILIACITCITTELHSCDSVIKTPKPQKNITS